MTSKKSNWLIGSTNESALDFFTLAHTAFGFSMAKAGVKMDKTLALAIIWELAEPSLKKAMPEIFPDASGDSALNSITDIIAAGVGHFLGDM